MSPPIEQIEAPAPILNSLGTTFLRAFLFRYTFSIIEKRISSPFNVSQTTSQPIERILMDKLSLGVRNVSFHAISVYPGDTFIFLAPRRFGGGSGYKEGFAMSGGISW